MKIGPFDFRFVEIFHELYAIEDYINSIEAQLPCLIERGKERSQNDRPQNDPFEWQQKEQELYELIEEVIPRYFRNPIVVTLWAVFESAIIEISKEIKDQKELSITLDDIRDDFLDRTKLYYNQILKFPLDVRGASWQHFRKFYRIRNAIAHGNGRLDNIKEPKNRKKIYKYEEESIGIFVLGGNIVCSPIFIRNTHSFVLKYLEEVTERVRKECPQPNNW